MYLDILVIHESINKKIFLKVKQKIKSMNVICDVDQKSILTSE